MGSKNRQIAMRRDVIVLVLYGLLSLALAWSLVVDIDKVVAGQNSDIHINLWADWWTKKALTENLNLFQTDYLFYPQGVSLVFHSFSHVNTLISLILTPLVGQFAAYNIVILLAFALSGFGTYLLVKYLTGCGLAAFIAGLVFAFPPYHRFESAHPVIVTTQWMPLFALALTWIIQGDGESQGRYVALAALWGVLTALSSWHLMLMLAGWTALYLIYHLLLTGSECAPGALRSLILVAVIIGVVLTPFVWPMVGRVLGPGISNMSADPDDGIGNDLLAFLIPNRANPVLHPLVSSIVEINDQTGFTGKRSAYLGYVPLVFAVIGGIMSREARLWLLSGVVSLILSLGAQIRFNGSPLHDFYLPWALPIIRILRHPFRLNVLTFFSLSVAVGFGVEWLHQKMASWHRALVYAGFFTLTALVLLEYLVVPFPTMKVTCSSPFLHRLAEEPGDFAVADFPMGRQKGKYYMFCQTIHGKRIAGGHVSRKPDRADAFIDGNPLLEQLDDEAAPDPEIDIEKEFQELAAQDFRYLVVHKRFLSPDEVETWKSWFPFPPSHEGDGVVVYRIPAEATEGPRVSDDGEGGPPTTSNDPVGSTEEQGEGP